MQSTKRSNAENNSTDKKKVLAWLQTSRKEMRTTTAYLSSVYKPHNHLAFSFNWEQGMEEQMGWTQKQVILHFLLTYQNWRTLNPYDATRINSNFRKNKD